MTRGQLRGIRRLTGPVLRLRGRKHVVEVPLSRSETIQVVIFLFLVTVILLLTMYVGWWTLQKEEQHDHGDDDLLGSESARTEMWVGFDSWRLQYDRCRSTKQSCICIAREAA
jgi:hypothetical protein